MILELSQPCLFPAHIMFLRYLATSHGGRGTKHMIVMGYPLHTDKSNTSPRWYNIAVLSFIYNNSLHLNCKLLASHNYICSYEYMNIALVIAW